MKLHHPSYVILFAVSISYGRPVPPEILLKAVSRLGGVVSSSSSISSTSIPVAYKVAKSHLLSASTASSRQLKNSVQATEEFLSPKTGNPTFLNLLGNLHLIH